MENLLKNNGENFTNVINAQNVGKKITLESNGKTFTLLKYFKSQPKADATEERPLKGNQTQITIKWSDTKQIESFVTAEIRRQFCPNYEVKPHDKKAKKTFETLFFELLEKCESETLKTALKTSYETQKAEAEAEAKLNKAKEALNGLTAAQIETLKGLGLI